MANRGKGKGKGKSKGKKTHRKAASVPDGNLTPPRTLPREILSNILSRLPVKTLFQFRCVCKRWRSLISSPKFIAAHSKRSQTIVFFHARGPAITAHMKKCLATTDRVQIIRHIPKPTAVRSIPNFSESDVSGCVNGVLCMSRPPMARDLVLWNPTTYASKSVFYPGPGPDPRFNSRVSVGFGYDSRADDYKIVLIMCCHQVLEIPDIAYVYSLRTGRWKGVKPDLRFWVIGTRCETVIEGMPYWRATEKDAIGVRPVLVYFNPQKDVFDLVSLPLAMNNTNACVGEFKGSLGMVVWPKSEEMAKGPVFDVWTRDDEIGWSKIFSIGPVSEFDRVVGFDENGIMGEDGEGTLFTYYFDSSKKVRESCFIKSPGRGSIDVVRYKESMVPIGGSNGMI